MTNEEKARLYKEMTYRHDLLQNQINGIKGESFELSQQQLDEIRKLESEQMRIRTQVERLLRS